MNMNSISDKLMNRFFKKVDGVVWDLMSGKIGIKTADGIAVITGTGDEAIVEINMLDQFGIEVPAFAQNTSTGDVQVGDLVVGSRGIQGWVIEKKEKTLVLMKPDGTRGSMTPPKVNMMGFEGGVLVLRSLVNMLPGGQGGLGQMQNMLMPMLMMGGDFDLEALMPMMLMSQMNAGPVDPANPNAALLQQNQMGQMMQMMMMAQMMGGSGKGKGFFDKRN